MYAWIWRHLPFGRWGKIGGSLLLVAGAAALLWFVVFPWMDPWLEEALLPWDEGQIEGDFRPGGDTVDPNDPAGPTTDPDEPLVGPDGQIIDDPHDIPYETDG
jgi:hypothetical protein